MNINIGKLVSILFGLIILTGIVQASQQSINVAIIGSPEIINEGYLPITGPIGELGDFKFQNLDPSKVTTANLTSFDTVVLNVASREINCNVNILTVQQKTDIISFVATGKKMIIYDSECSPQDYNWLPFKFTTANPGQQGAQGFLIIREENTLSSNNPANPYFIDTGYLNTSTDAVGDMNVMTTFDPYWKVDMVGTNFLNKTGPVHTYATYPAGTDKGLFIYNGLDMDDMGSGNNSLRKIWVQELRQKFSPSDLPGTIAVVGITLGPGNAKNIVGQSHTVTARLTDLLGNHQSGVDITFNIVSGPNNGSNSHNITDSNGNASFTYKGNNVGIDEIKACFTKDGQLICSQVVTKEWVTNLTGASYAYVSNANSNNISVVDTETDKVITTINVGNSPSGVVANPTGTKVYVANADSKSISVIDTATNKVIDTINVGRKVFGIVINQLGTKVYATNYNDNSVSVVDTTTRVVDTINVGRAPLGIAINPSGTKVYVANYWNDSVTIIDTASNAIDSFPAGSHPTGVAVNKAGTKVYVVNSFSHNVYAVDTATNNIIDTINVGSYPACITLNKAGTLAYVTNGVSKDLSIIDTTTDKVLTTIGVGSSEDGIVINPEETKLYVAMPDSNSTSVIDTTTNKVIDTINVGVNPRQIAMVQGISTQQPVANTGTLSVITTPVNGNILVDGLSKGRSWSGPVNTGSHTVTFDAVSGYTTPLQQIVNVNTGQTTTVTGIYVPIQTSASISVDSGNYAGYAVKGKDSTGKDLTYSDIKGDWTVSKTTCSKLSGISQSATWVGLGGFDIGNDHKNKNIAQIGIYSACNNGNLNYYPIFEMYESDDKGKGIYGVVPIPIEAQTIGATPWVCEDTDYNKCNQIPILSWRYVLINGQLSITPVVNAGDKITAEIKYDKKASNYILSLHDITQKWHTNLPHLAFIRKGSPYERYSAEWIVELPESQTRLSQFDPNVIFTNAKVDDKSITSGPIVYKANMTISGSNPVVTRADTLTLDNTGSSFSVKWRHE